MGRISLVMALAFLAGCGAHAPTSVIKPTSPLLVRHFAGQQMITFTGGNGAWLPSGDVALENTAHEAVRGLLKLKADQIREKIPGSQLLSGRAWGGRVVRKDSDGTVYVLVKYEAEIGLPAGVPIGTLAFNLSSRH